MKVITYVDMDGCIVKWNPDASLEDTFKPGYFANREPDLKLILTIKRLIAAGQEVVVLTAVYEDDHSRQDKLIWLKKYGLENVKVIFVPYGKRKIDYIDTTNCICILIDDFSKNLFEWVSNDFCYGIKYMNGINGTKGTWDSFMVSNKMNQDAMYITIQAIINEVAAVAAA